MAFEFGAEAFHSLWVWWLAEVDVYEGKEVYERTS